MQAEKLDSVSSSVTSGIRQMEERLKTLETTNEQKLDNMRSTIEQRLALIQADNTKRLEEMRATVDEKLQKTLENRMTQSFQLVNERLEQVYKGLGEMQSLAQGIGDLKKVLSNVKTRGILGRSS
jgi:DNA recombination protein RmuC